MRLVLAVLAASLAVAGCAALTPPTGSPAPSPTPAARTTEEAARLVLESDPRFAGITRRDPELIGQGSWWEAEAVAGGFEVTVRIGWGDCPAGCISEHRWVFAVGADGTVTLLSEQGDPLPGGGQVIVEGLVTAGPVCPVEQDPPDPACAPRAVAGATLVVSDAAGTVVATLVSDATGAFSVALPPGSYTLVAEPVEGLMGTPAPLPFTAELGAPLQLIVEYDTGIR